MCSQLNLSDNKIGGYYDMEEHKVIYTTEGPNAIADALLVHASLTSLSVAGNGIVGDGAQQLASTVLAKPTLEHFSGIPLKELRADSLTTLDLSRKRLGVAEAIVLADLLRSVSTSLTSLDVRNNEITGDSASQLSAAVVGNLKIETFNEIPIKQMRADTLTELNLHGMGMGVVGAMVVAGLVPVMASLTELNIDGNDLGENGALAIASAIKSASSLALQKLVVPSPHEKNEALKAACASKNVELV